MNENFSHLRSKSQK